MPDAVSLCALSGCDLCATASSLATTTGDVVVCDCERVWEPRQRPSGVVDVATPRPQRRETAEAPRRSPRLVYVAPDEAPTVNRSPLERAGAEARSLAAVDPELVRVRRLLADLRPDCHDPLVPPLDGSKELPPPPPLRLEGEDDWCDLPRGLVLGGINASEFTLAEQRASVASVLESIGTAEERAEKAEAALVAAQPALQLEAIRAGRIRCEGCGLIVVGGHLACGCCPRCCVCFALEAPHG